MQHKQLKIILIFYPMVKIRTTGGENNGSGDVYAFWAFAEQPFVNSNGVPGNAR